MENKENMNADNKPHGETSTEKIIMKDNKVNEKLARKEGYVPFDEIDEKYDPTENKEMKKVIDEKKEQIESLAKEYLKKELGREVIIDEITAIYPYSAIHISYHTVTKPMIYASLDLNVSKTGQFDLNDFYGVDIRNIKLQLANAIIKFAYEDEVLEWNKFIELNFSNEYVKTQSDSFVSIVTIINQSKEQRTEFAEQLYQMYEKNSNRTSIEWKKILSEYNDMLFLVDISVYLKDTQALPTEEKLERLATKFKTIPNLLPGTYEFNMMTSWLTTRDYHSLETLHLKKIDFNINKGRK